MKLGLMQPYFFPYLGYFDLIVNTDRWVVFDTAQYIRFGWVNRNRVLHPTKGWTYITVPVRKHARSTPIIKMHISSSFPWQQAILNQLTTYRKHAPNYKKTVQLVQEVFAYETTSLSLLNLEALKKVCQYLEIETHFTLFSDFCDSIGPINCPGDWALRTCEALGANVYINPPGGRDLYDPEKFRNSGIELIIREFPTFVYPTPGYTFEPNLSIIDVLMWNTPEQVREYLDRVKLSG